MRHPRHGFFTFLIGALIASLALVACSQPQPAGPPPSGPREVGFIVVAPERVELTTELPSRTVPHLIAEVRPQTGGLVQKRLFTEGADVQAGQILYQIDPATHEAALDNALASHLATIKTADRARAALLVGEADVTRLRATLELAQTNRQRYEESFMDKTVSAIQRDQAVTEAKVAEAALMAARAQVESAREAVAVAEAQIQQAEAALKMARLNLGYASVTAPISGRIGKSSITAGAIVTAYQPMALATIQQLDPIYVDAPQSATDLLRLKNRLQKGLLSKHEKDQNKVDLILEDGTSYPLVGKLQFSDVSVDATTGSVILRAAFPNPDGLLLPGMFVRAVIREGVVDKAILVPQQGVARDPKGNPFALIVDAEDKAGMRPLTLDRAIGDRWLVAAGLAPGDRVIVEGLQMLKPGMAVKAAPFEEKGANPASAAQPASTAK